MPFRFTEINRGTADEPTFDFSFSGIKTAVLRYVETHGMKPAIEARRAVLAGVAAPTLDEVRSLCDTQTLDLIASFQHAVVGNLVRQTLGAAAHHGVQTMVVSGGVAANRAPARTLWGGSHAARPGCPLPCCRAVHRQCSHDRGGGLAEAAAG